MIDICLLLEGTYPYVAGGVSTWVHQLIRSMPDLRFGIIFIAPHSEFTRKMKYEMPEQVILLKEIYLHDYDENRRCARRPKQSDFDLIRQFHERMMRGDYQLFAKAVRLFREDGCFDLYEFFYSKKIWRILTEFYSNLAADVSFMDFFWTWRSIQMPILQVMRADIPEAKIYHSISTGYAGLLGAVAKSLHPHSRYFITEHGIYVHERFLEIAQANWIYETEKNQFRVRGDLSFFKQWWIAVFQVMGQIAYLFADRIFTLYEGNRVRQILNGAQPEKISVIPNGIDRKVFERTPKQPKRQLHIAFIGRVVSIKDVKTFIYAVKIVRQIFPTAHFFIIGPNDEEEEYYDECRLLAETLGLEGHLTFTGRADPKIFYPSVDVVVLTSISEAQPYVILEANAMGIPVIVTDVGDCRDMVEGKDYEDKMLGPSGLVTEVSNPQATADAIVKLLSDQEFYQKCGDSGRERVKRYYDQDDMLGSYLNLYEQSL